MIPQELKDDALWCCWKREERDGRMTKIPYDPKNQKWAKANDPSTFTDYEEAEWKMKACDYDGLGIYIGNGFSAIDIDHCFENGSMSDMAKDILNTMQSYAEYSPSKTGIRILFKAPDFVYDTKKYYINNQKKGLEVYVHGATKKYVSITGDTLIDAPIREASKELQTVLQKYMERKDKPNQGESRGFANTGLTDEQIISKASREEKFSRLFSGDMTDYSNDHSAADLGLMNRLAFWTGCDAEQMDRIFRKSGLYREKWDREDYRNTTIDMAIRDCTKVYDAKGKRSIWALLDAPELVTGEWTVGIDGIYREKVLNKRGDIETEYACVAPIALAAHLENVDTGIHKVELHYLYNGDQRKIICEKETVANRHKIITLSNSGIPVTSGSSFALMQYLYDLERLNPKAIPYYKAVGRLGWIGDAFMPYDGHIKFDGEADNRATFRAVVAKGNLEDWVQYTRKLRSNIYLRMMMAASFASPLIKKVGTSPFIFHLWGGTEVGKTVALMVAMSIWGDPSENGLLRSMNATSNAMLNGAGFMHSLPFAADELQTIRQSGVTYDKLIMTLTEGRDRDRMKYHQAVAAKTWACSFLFTGEEPIVQSNSGGGAKNRVIEVECKQKVIENGNETATFVRDIYGVAGRPFVEYIKSKDIIPLFRETFSDIINRVDTTEKQATAMALLLLGDRLSGECLYPGEKPLDVLEIAPFLSSKQDVDVAERAYGLILDLVARNYPKFRGEGSEIWGKQEGHTLFINKDVLDSLLDTKGISFEAVKAKWDEKGYLIKNAQGRYTHSTSCFGSAGRYMKLSVSDDFVLS